MWAVVIGIGLPAALFNWTALALCGTWLLAEYICWRTGINMPLPLYFVFDYFVLLVIFLKPERCDMSPYRTFADQIKALWYERCPGDVVVAGIFPIMWLLYVADIGDFYRWWALWGLVQIQFFAAGWEAYASWREGRKKETVETPPGALRVGIVGHG